MTEQVKNIILAEVEKQNLSLYDIEYVKEGPDWFLRVIVDKEVEGGVELEDLVALNHVLCESITDSMMDKEYMLEVCSPGAERKLRNYDEINKYMGSYIYIKTYEKIAGVKEFYGDLTALENDIVTIKVNKKLIEIAYSKISTIRLAIKF